MSLFVLSFSVCSQSKQNVWAIQPSNCDLTNIWIGTANMFWYRVTASNTIIMFSTVIFTGLDKRQSILFVCDISFPKLISAAQNAPFFTVIHSAVGPGVDSFPARLLCSGSTDSFNLKDSFDPYLFNKWSRRFIISWFWICPPSYFIQQVAPSWGCMNLHRIFRSRATVRLLQSLWLICLCVNVIGKILAIIHIILTWHTLWEQIIKLNLITAEIRRVLGIFQE